MGSESFWEVYTDSLQENTVRVRFYLTYDAQYKHTKCG